MTDTIVLPELVWCPLHNGGNGARVPRDQFARHSKRPPNYVQPYCKRCKQEWSGIKFPDLTWREKKIAREWAIKRLKERFPEDWAELEQEAFETVTAGGVEGLL